MRGGSGPCQHFYGDLCGKRAMPIVMGMDISMLKIILLRHFPTSGNLLKRYIGVTDEGLCPEEIPDLDQVKFPPAEAVFVSPLTRCRETARLVYPELIPVVCEDFRECDFGEFENKNYMELDGNEKYQEWVDSGGTLPFPGGEAVWDFKKRCTGEFQRVISHSLIAGYQAVALVVHGGTIMSILEQYADPKQDYYYWHTENGNGYVAEWKRMEDKGIEARKVMETGKEIEIQKEIEAQKKMETKKEIETRKDMETGKDMKTGEDMETEKEEKAPEGRLVNICNIR